MRWLVDASAARHSGALTHHLGLLPALDRQAGADEIRVLVSEALAGALDGRLESLALEVVRHRAGLGRVAALNSVVGAEIRGFRPDGVVFGQYAPWGASAPYVLRMTDAHLVDPEQRRRVMPFYSPFQRAAWQVKLRVFDRSVRRAGAVLCATRAVRDQLIEARPELDTARIHVAPYGLSPLAGDAGGPDGATDRGDPGGSDRTRLLTMHLSPRKNVELILDALARPGMESFELTVLGDLDDPTTRYTRFLAERARSLGVASRVRSAGYIGDAERLRREVVAHDAVLCPSRIESWSHTVVEGMALGVPVVASDIACHREVTDGAAWLVPVDDAEALAAAIRDATAAGPRRDERVRRARALARGYEWSAYAAGMLTTLRTAASASAGLDGSRR